MRHTDDEIGSSVELLGRRIPAGGPGDERTRKRGLGLLLRRGYEPELAYTAVRRFFEDR